jgi:hypothetical protein
MTRWSAPQYRRRPSPDPAGRSARQAGRRRRGVVRRLFQPRARRRRPRRPDDLQGPAAERHGNPARPELPPAEVDHPLIARIDQICSCFRHLPLSEKLFASRRFSQRHSLRRQPLKHGAGGLHIRGRETFGEPIINRCKQCSRLVAATLAHPQTGNAERDPQLPK